jgi:hypothetical protein
MKTASRKCDLPPMRRMIQTMVTLHERDTPSKAAVKRATRKNPPEGNGRTETQQTELRFLRDALWEAINGIEDNAPGARIESELLILDRVADALGRMMEPNRHSEFMWPSGQ